MSCPRLVHSLERGQRDSTAIVSQRGRKTAEISQITAEMTIRASFNEWLLARKAFLYEPVKLIPHKLHQYKGLN